MADVEMAGCAARRFELSNWVGNASRAPIRNDWPVTKKCAGAQITQMADSRSSGRRTGQTAHTRVVRSGPTFVRGPIFPIPSATGTDLEIAPHFFRAKPRFGGSAPIQVRGRL